MKAVIKDNKNIIISKLNSQELAVLTNFLEKASYYKAELSELRNIDNEYDGLNINITNIPKQEIQYNSPYNITLLPNTIANIDLGVDAETEIEITNEYSEYLNVELLSNKTINVNLIEDEELRNSFKTYKLGFKLSKETFEDINLEIQVNAIYSYSGASKMSELENDIGLIDNTVDDLVNYYTKTETDDLLDTKQDTLTAGTNITIENGTISAIDTIYDDTQIRTDISNIESDINNLESDKVDKIQGKGLSTNDYTDEEKSKLASLENYDDTELRSDISNLNNTKADKSELPVNVSELNNDADYTTKKYVDDSIPDVSNFITNSVDNLVNYYKKSETYTQTEVNTLIGNIQHFHYEIVQSLPQSGETNIIYLVPKSTSQTNNYYDEYVYANNAWEKIGDTEIDLSSYVTTDALNSALQDYTTTTDLTTLLASKQEALVSGTNIKTINNTSLLGGGNITVNSTGIIILEASLDNSGQIINYNTAANISALQPFKDYNNREKYNVILKLNLPYINNPTYIPAGDLHVINTTHTSGNLNYYCDMTFYFARSAFYNRLRQFQLIRFSLGTDSNDEDFVESSIDERYLPSIDTFNSYLRIPQFNSYIYYDGTGLSEYDTTATYNIGDYCYYTSNPEYSPAFIYKCKSDNTTGWWSDSKWEQKTYDDYLNDCIIPIKTYELSGLSEYDTTVTYNTGDYCYYKNAIYKCKDDNITGAWDSTKWDSKTYKQYLSDTLVGSINTILATLTTPSNNGGE